MKKESKTMTKTLDVITMGLVSSGNARNQILEFLDLEGIQLPDLRAKTVDDFLREGKATGDAKTLLEIRRALSKASTAKYNKFLLCAKSDSRVRDLFLYCGASTGRWGGKNVQPQNFPRGIIKDIDSAIENINQFEVEDLKLLYGENLMPLFSSVLRGMFIASPGHEMFVQDYNAIETRVLFWLANHEAGLEMFHTGQDPYRDQASDIFDKPIIEISDDERQVGKAAVLGCGYQMGPKKFMTAAWDVYRAKVSIELAKVAVTSYRKKHYPVTELWENYYKAACFAVENPTKKFTAGKCFFYMEKSFLMIELPSGRRLAYKDPVTMFEDVILRNDEGEVINKFTVKKLKFYAINHKAKRSETVIPKWSLETTYGGKITENIVQAVSRDLLAFAIVNAEQSGFKVLMHAHDELVCEAPKGKFTNDDYKKIMETLPPWAEGLPLKASGWTGLRYKKG
jgi:DNA polymerase